MKKYLLPTLLVLFAAAACTPDDKVFAESDRQFIDNAYQRNLLDIQRSQIVRTRGRNADVKRFAELMIRDASVLSDEIIAHAQKRAYTLPVELQPAYQSEVNALLNVADADFERSYLSGLISSRKKSIELYEKQIKNGSDNSLREWASGKISKFAQEISSAQELEDRY